ncbi:hypothetical protein [Lichenibacterium dinghuense]|uniref:hypothetical protein n=1 Tax=Lichenibacterium dinghuense TaxID=2895977 RepID=UPI001F276951|nr:hypothetical protein [Lichenibacterium sp. 6Y81]
MTLMKTIAAACVASALLTGTASAADLPGAMSHGSGAVPHYRHSTYRHGASLFGLGRHSTAAGRAKQRHRTHLDRCQNVPSRC